MGSALMDALLGALALGDIGQHFPDSDERYRGIDSMELLRHVAKLVAEKGWQLGNADMTIIAQKPRMLPHIPLMREKIAHALDTDTDNISVKATTEEGLGFTGTEQGIAAHAVVLIETLDKK